MTFSEAVNCPSGVGPTTFPSICPASYANTRECTCADTPNFRSVAIPGQGPCPDSRCVSVDSPLFPRFPASITRHGRWSFSLRLIRTSVPLEPLDHCFLPTLPNPQPIFYASRSPPYVLPPGLPYLQTAISGEDLYRKSKNISFQPSTTALPY